MVIRIKNLHDGAVRNIRSIGKYKPYEIDSEKNSKKMRRLFNDLKDKKIDFIALEDGETENGWKPFRVYHRSPKYNEGVQLSYGWYDREGKLVPCGDCYIPDFDEFEREGYPSGTWRAEKIA